MKIFKKKEKEGTILPDFEVCPYCDANIGLGQPHRAICITNWGKKEEVKE